MTQSSKHLIDYVFMRPPGGEPSRVALDHGDPEQISRLMVAGWSQHFPPAEKATTEKEPE